MKPILVINFKTYKNTIGEKGVKLARICEEVAKKTNSKIIVTVQEVEIRNISSNVNIPVYSEHIDATRFGAYTGHNLPEALKQNGAAGTLINHSEDRSKLKHIKQALDRAKQVGLKTIACAPSPKIASKIAKFKPVYIAIEPPELIGGEKSVSSAKPKIITKTIKKVNQVNPVPVLCGAGVKNKKDVAKSIELGAAGVLVASHVVKAKDPEKVLRNLVKGFKNGS
ncbi:MAG: Triosephosphate isomerase [Candidatus Woesearchaeota archaeon]|nr:Triosephosphate isomerase [Candidatus Woesearchaeota archaeon]